jgi:hypothetical protein
MSDDPKWATASGTVEEATDPDGWPTASGTVEEATEPDGWATARGTIGDTSSPAQSGLSGGGALPQQTEPGGHSRRVRSMDDPQAVNEDNDPPEVPWTIDGENDDEDHSAG